MKLLVFCRADLFRDGLQLLLESRLPFCRVEFACPGLVPPVPVDQTETVAAILVDLALEEVPPDGLIRMLVDRWPEIPVLGLYGGAQEANMPQCLQAGALACVRKDAPAEVLLAALQVVLSPAVFLRRSGQQPGQIRLSATRPSVLSDLPDPSILSWSGPLTPADRASGAALPGEPLSALEGDLINGLPTTAASLGLTPKQRRVLALLLEGKSNKNIARELGLCTGTVKTHTTAVLRALNVNTRVQAVVAARRLGLHADSSH